MAIGQRCSSNGIMTVPGPLSLTQRRLFRTRLREESGLFSSRAEAIKDQVLWFRTALVAIFRGNPIMAELPQFLSQADIDAAVGVFRKLEDFEQDEVRRTIYRRQAGDVRILMSRAASEAPETLSTPSALRDAIRQSDESDMAAFGALLHVLPYLTGAFGPYALEFHHAGSVLSHVRHAPDGTWDIRDTEGRPLPLDEVYLMLRRRSARPTPHDEAMSRAASFFNH